MQMGKQAKENKAEVGRRIRTSLYIQSIGYEIKKIKLKNHSLDLDKKTQSES
jgi:hypothetical protein